MRSSLWQRNFQIDKCIQWIFTWNCVSCYSTLSIQKKRILMWKEMKWEKLIDSLLLLSVLLFYDKHWSKSSNSIIFRMADCQRKDSWKVAFESYSDWQMSWQVNSEFWILDKICWFKLIDLTSKSWSAHKIILSFKIHTFISVVFIFLSNLIIVI